MRYHEMSGVEVVQNYLNEHNYSYTVRDEGFYEFILEKDEKHELFIRCIPRGPRVRVIHWIPLDKDIVKVKWGRIMDACNVTNTNGMLHAMAFDDGVAIKYQFPEVCITVMPDALTEVLYEFHINLNLEVFEKALSSDEDLYQYNEKWIQDRLDEYRKRRDDGKQGNEQGI